MMNRKRFFSETRYLKNQVILNQGDKSNTSFYLVQEGQVLLRRRIEVKKLEFQTFDFSVLQPGQTFNEQSVLVAQSN